MLTHRCRYAVNIWQISLVSGARKRASIKYPQVYATKEEESQSPQAKAFNCTQRAHQNSLEYGPTFILTSILGGLRYPRITVAAAATYLVGRVFYTLGKIISAQSKDHVNLIYLEFIIGYSTGTPTKRLPGFYASSVSLVVLLITSTTTVASILYESDFKL